MSPGYTIPKNGENNLEKDSAKEVKACVGLYDNDKNTNMSY
jgi:hypothetical protein